MVGSHSSLHCTEPTAAVGMRPPTIDARMQMPLGRMAWWDAIREKYLRGQQYGMGMDLAWTAPVGRELSTALVDSGALSLLLHFSRLVLKSR